MCPVLLDHYNRMPGQADCSYSPLEAARASFCSTNEQVCIPHKQMQGLAKSMHRKYLGSSIVDRADGVMVVFENNVVSTSVFESTIYEYHRDPHRHPKGWEDTEITVPGKPAHHAEEHSIEIRPIESAQGECKSENCVENIICVDSDVDLSIDGCTKTDLSRETRTRLDQIYKDAVSGLYVQNISKGVGVNPCNPCAGKNPCNPCAGVNPCNPCAGKNPCSGKRN